MPRTRRATQTGLSPTSPQKTAKNNNIGRAPVQSSDLCVGCILWLPAKNPHYPQIKCSQKLCCNGEELNDDGYDHPAVVLSIHENENSAQLSDSVCQIAFLTSFGSTSLSSFTAERPRTRKFQTAIPIISRDADTINALDLSSIPSLHLEQGEMYVQSYVRLNHTYMVPVTMLRQYHNHKAPAKKWRLDKKSYKKLMRELRMVPEKYENKGTLLRTSEEQRSELAQSTKTAYQIHHPIVQAQIDNETSRYQIVPSEERVVLPLVSGHPATPSRLAHVPDYHTSQYMHGYGSNSGQGSILPSYHQLPPASPSRPAHVPNTHRAHHGYRYASTFGQDSLLPSHHQPPPGSSSSKGNVLVGLLCVAGSIVLGSLLWWYLG